MGQVQALGELDFIWIPRSSNAEADRLCSNALDEMEAGFDGYESED